MKPRILRTQKLLAVAITTAAAGCAERPPAPVAETAASIPHAAPAHAPAPAPAPLDPVPPSTPPAAQIAPAAVHLTADPAPPERPLSSDPALLALRDKLAGMKPEAALAERARFRPLCDADGYPLVGNLARKGPTYQASAFCRDLRAKPAR